MDAWDALLRAMRTARGPRPRRIGAREAEQLLTGAPVGPDRRELVHLLSAAAGPACGSQNHDPFLHTSLHFNRRSEADAVRSNFEVTARRCRVGRNVS